MLIGRQDSSVDAKGRIIFPAKFREDMGESFIVTLSFLGYKCLYAYSQDEWKKLEDALSQLPKSKVQGVQRQIFANAVCVTPDKQGRFIIPSHLRDKAGIEKEVSVLGVSDRVEIWDKVTFEASESELDGEKMGEIMMSLNY